MVMEHTLPPTKQTEQSGERGHQALQAKSIALRRREQEHKRAPITFQASAPEKSQDSLRKRNRELPWCAYQKH